MRECDSTQDIMEPNDVYTVPERHNTRSPVGTHNEFLNFKNLFIRDNFGTYFFNSLNTFEAGKAQQDHRQLLCDAAIRCSPRRSRFGSGASMRAISGAPGRT